MKRGWYWVVMMGAVLLGATESQGQVVVRSNEYVTQEHTQTSAGGPEATGEYRFVLEGSATSRDFVQFILPDATVSLGANQVYPSLGVLQTAHPPGTYTAQLEHWARPTGPVTMHTLEADFPESLSFQDQVPTITNDDWSEGVLLVDPNFTLTIDPWVGRPDDSLIQLRLLGPPGGFTWNAYSQDLTSVTFGGEGNAQLQPNSTYQGVLTFVDYFDSVSTPIPGSSPISQDEFRFDLGTGNSVRFTIVTVPEPRVWVLFGAGAIFLVWKRGGLRRA